MNNYELVVLYHPDLEIDLAKPLKKVEGLITEAGGKVLHFDNWGKRKLAYPIDKQEYAVYCYYELELAPEKVNELEKLLNITDEAIRFLIARPTPNFGDREKSRPAEDDEAEEEDDTKTSRREAKQTTKEEDNG